MDIKGANFTHGIPGLILKGKYHSARGGISDHVQEVTIVGKEVRGLRNLRPVTPDAPAVVVAYTTPTHAVLRPLDHPGKEYTSFMASGAYVEMSGGSLFEDDWRRIFGHTNPVQLHDMCETWDTYRRMSID